MAFYGYHGDADKWITTPYDPSYYYETPLQSDYQYGETHLAADHNSPACASYTDYWLEPPSEQGYSLFDYSEPIAYHHSPYNYYTDPSGIKYSEPVEYHHPSNNSYNYYYTDPSETKYSEPKLLQYHPSSYSTHYFPTDTTFTISYATTSTQEFNEPEFEEYDPTPYGGGYDPDTTYGKPLPPSDIICYPRKLPQSDSGTSPEVFSYSSVPSPYGNNDDDTSIKAPVVEKEEDDVTIKAPVVEKEEDDVTIKAPAVEKQDDDLPIKAEDEGSRDFEIVGSPEENPIASESPFYESGYRAEYFYGSGLESMDLCDALFGYWPCLAKRDERLRRKKEEIYEEERRLDPWNKCAEYFFGGPGQDYNNSKAQHLQYQ